MYGVSERWVMARKSSSDVVRQIDWPLVVLILAMKGLIIIFGALSYEALEDRRIEGFRGWLEIWNRWDAPHYLDIAQHGYQATGEMGRWLVFFPLFPWLTRLVALGGSGYLVSAMVVSGLASLAAGILLQRLVEIDNSPATAWNAAWFLFIFPTSYFLHIGYTESLFLALTLGCFLAAHRQHWLLAGVLGALTSLTRINGLILIPALLVEALYQYRIIGRWQWCWLSIGIVALGFGIYLLINLRVAGDPFAFLSLQQVHWYKALAWPWTGIWETIKSSEWRAPADAQMVIVQELHFIALGFICMLACWATLRPSYSMWITGNWLLFTSTSFVYSVPRFTLVLFPIYILFARLAGHRLWYAVITAWSLLFLALFTSLFVRGHWAF